MINGGGKRRALGRGLGALIVDTRTTAPTDLDVVTPESSGATADGVCSIPLDNIAPNPQQPRALFDPAALEELAASIREHGIIQPLLVTTRPDEPDKYWLIAGERRWRAARLAELETVPAIVRDASPEQLVELALVENLQRADLNPLEEAAAFQTLVDEFALTQAEIGQRVGKSRAAIANTLRLLQLPRPIQEALGDGRISAGHGRALLALPDHDAMEKALARIVARALSVRQTEEYVKQVLLAATQAAEPVAVAEPTVADAHLAHLENRFRAVLGTRVNLARNKDGSGRLVVHFYSEEDLNNLYQLIAGDEDVY